MTINYLNNRGFSVGFKDSVIDDKLNESNIELINSKVLLVKHMITQFENEKDEIDKTIIEDSIKAELNAVMPNIGKVITESLNNDNAYYALLKSGAKGSVPNIAQIMGCMGQISHEGGRINKSVNGRALVAFHKYDDTPNARGFIQSNLLEGLKGSEFFLKYCR